MRLYEASIIFVIGIVFVYSIVYFVDKIEDNNKEKRLVEFCTNNVNYLKCKDLGGSISND